MKQRHRARTVASLQTDKERLRLRLANQDLQPAGTCGNASAVDAKRGAELVERAASLSR